MSALTPPHIRALRGISRGEPATGQGYIVNPDGVLEAAEVLPWRIDVIPFTPAVLETGTWANAQASNQLLGGTRFNSAGAQNDEVGWDLVLAAGTWRIDLVHDKSTASGIATARIDGSSVGTIDAYNGSSTRANASSVTGITVSTSGKHRVSLKMATKNASSSAYFLSFNMLTMRRTA